MIDKEQIKDVVSINPVGLAPHRSWISNDGYTVIFKDDTEQTVPHDMTDKDSQTVVEWKRNKINMENI
jgi:hypothetical protein